RFADPDAALYCVGVGVAEHANEVGAIGGPVKDQYFGRLGKDPARGLGTQVVLEQGMFMYPDLVQIENAVSLGMPAHSQVGSDVARVIAGRFEQCSRLDRLAGFR